MVTSWLLGMCRYIRLDPHVIALVDVQDIRATLIKRESAACSWQHCKVKHTADDS